MKIKLTSLIIFSLLLQFLDVKSQSFEDEFQFRSKQVINGIADGYALNPPGTFNGNCSLSDFGKYHYPKMMAVFSKYGFYKQNNVDTVVDLMNSRLIRFSTCPTFHFNLVGVPRLLYQFKDAPGLSNPQTVKNYLDGVFNRSDSYNAFTAEGTENHTSMNRTSGYLYCQYAIDNFPTNYPTAPSLKDSMKTWILYTSKKIVEVGTGEWNSSTYGVFNMIGWLSLYDFATDVEVKNAARAVLDYYSAELALHYYLGMTSGPEMRGPAKLSINKETDFISWLWFGKSTKTISNTTFSVNNPLSTIHFALSSYRPSDITIKLGKKTLAKDTMYYNSKPSYLLDQASYIKQTFYIGKDYTLGAAYIPYGGWASGDYQMCSWKLVSSVDSSNAGNAQYISGQGGVNYTGNYRYPFDQVVHHKNVIVQMTKVPTNAASILSNISTKFDNWISAWQNDFSSRFPGDSKDNPVNFQNPPVNAANNTSFISLAGGTITNSVSTTVSSVRIITLDKTYLLVRSINGTTAPVLTSNLLSDAGVTLGTLCGFVVEVASKTDYPTIAQLNTAIATTSLTKVPTSDSIYYINLKGESIGIKYQVNGTFTEPIYDWGYGPTKVNGFSKHTSPPFIQPTWPSGMGHGKIAKWTINNTLVDLNKRWPVYSGANLTVDSSKIKLSDNGCQYSVNYSGINPIFTSVGCNARNKQEINISSIPKTISKLSNNNLAANSSSGLSLNYVVLSGPATVTGNQLIASDTGNITLAIYQNGSSNYFAAYPKYILIKSVLSLDEDKSTIDQTALSIYPNPLNNNTLQIYSSYKTKLLISDINGKVILENENIEIGYQSIDLPNISNGVYLVKINQKVLKLVVCK